MKNAVCRHAGKAADNRGDQGGKQRPEKAARFLFDGQKRGGAGPVKQRKEDDADRRSRCPAVRREQGVHGFQSRKLRETALCHVGHDDDGNDRFVGGKAEDERHEDDTVHAEQTGKGIEEIGAVLQKRDVTAFDVGKQPNEQSCGRGDRRRTSEHKGGAIPQGTPNDLADLRSAIGRQLQRERGRHAVQQRF